MKAFAQLFQLLDETNKTNEKVVVLKDYLNRVPDDDKMNMLALFTGRRPKRPINSTLVRNWALEASNIPDWLFEESYHVVGDLAETMALLMPLSLPTALALGHAAGFDPATLQTLCAAVIGAVFGGATFGDHCSPFSDTTIVAALASGCDTMDHVITQLPFAMLVALSAEVGYAAIAFGVPAWAATLGAAACMLLALAALVGGSLRDGFNALGETFLNTKNVGYSALFIASAVFFILGIIFLLRVKEPGEPDE